MAHMTMGHKLRSIVLSLCVAACAPAGPGSPPTPMNDDIGSDEDTCGMSAFAHLVGAPIAELDRSALPAGTRILAPDMQLTADIMPQRLTIQSDTAGNVASLGCY